MTFYIITGLDLLNGRVERLPIGYVTSKTEADNVNNMYCMEYRAWVRDNIVDLDSGNLELKDYLDVNINIYEVGWVTNSLGDSGLMLITDITKIGL